MNRGIKIFLLILGVVMAGLLAAQTRDRFDGPGWFVYDLLQKRFPAPESQNVAIFFVDQMSLNEVETETSLSWPWPREIYGYAAKVAKHLGAKSLIFDIIFDAPSSFGVDDDEAFNQALRSNDLVYVFPSPNKEGTVRPPFERITRQLNNVRLGAVVLPTESDGVYRNVPTLFDGPLGKTVPPLGLAALDEAPSRQDHFIHYPSKIPQVSFYNLIKAYKELEEKGRFSEKIEEILSRQAGKHWFIGYRAPGLLDYKPTPVNPNAAGVEVHGSLLENVLSGARLRRASMREFFISTVVIGLIILAIGLGASRPMPALIGMTLTLIFGVPATAGLYWKQSVWLNPWPVFAGDILFGIGLLSWRFQTQWKERQRLAAAVENSMSKDMVQLIRTGQLEVTRFGERREITILFSDLSGFTTIAEKMDAGELVRLLNHYLDEAVELIFKHDGYVDKFIGDAVMALWGAPIVGQKNHARLALQAAIGFDGAVQRFNQTAIREFKIEGPIFTARVGLHTGDAIVGNIGSKDRHNYTAIGDSVNLAARLESLGKQYDCILLISQDAVEAAGAEGLEGLVEVDSVSVKGRTQPTRIFTYVHDQGPDIDNYKNALEKYRRGEWQAAQTLFEKSARVPSWEVMAERCRQAVTDGTPTAWQNGVWIHDSK